jgi:hypothetical protein
MGSISVLGLSCPAFNTTGRSKHDGMVRHLPQQWYESMFSFHIPQQIIKALMFRSSIYSLFTITLIDVKGCVTYDLTGDSCEH